MTLIDPREGDVAIRDSDGTKWKLVAKRAQTDFWAYNNNTDSYITIRLADYPLFTKREPRFEVGGQYVNSLDPVRIVYTAAVVQGTTDVLLWWVDPATGVKLSSWIPYDARKDFTEAV